jgi:ferrochelatase
MNGATRIAVVLFNLGGPDCLAAVRPFLFNLFNDPAIIGAPAPIRWLLAQLISRRRAPVARDIYREIGGASPILPNTQSQAHALETALNQVGGRSGGTAAAYKVFIAMRYWHPRADATALAVQAYAPDRIVLLPLYPQYSSTTTGSSLGDWAAAAQRIGLTAPSCAICCYPHMDGFIEAMAAGIRPHLEAAGARGPVRLLLSAHGLPKSIVARGDPYRWQVERTAAALAARLGDTKLDWRVCYQSRVGPLDWIGPATDAEIALAGRERRALVIAPIAFVSEHSETLVELDIEYARLASEAGAPAYRRAPTVDASAAFIAGLAGLVRNAAAKQRPLISAGGERLCPAACGLCPLPGMS